MTNYDLRIQIRIARSVLGYEQCLDMPKTKTGLEEEWRDLRAECNEAGLLKVGV